jgi:hypothetical protein
MPIIPIVPNKMKINLVQAEVNASTINNINIVASSHTNVE